MQFNADTKAVIANYLKDGQRNKAIQYISDTFKTNHYDSQKLLEAFEQQFGHELNAIAPSKKFDGSACSGCLSKILKVISILLILISGGVFVIGYFLVPLVGEQWNTRRVPVVVTGMVYPYGDSTYVNLIYEYRDTTKVMSDTSSMDYNATTYHVGDTIPVSAHDLNLALDTEALNQLQERQRIIYYVGASIFITALLLLVVSIFFRVRPPSKETSGRYTQ